jgi:[1-hydroxy-2-(trimethylamino)ethyl]phosphonate dioxygenase
MNIIDQIISNYTNNKSLYIGEKVTMSEHMIQTAMLAEKNNCSSNLVCSSLLHDYGHFILENPDDLITKDKDGRHEDVGYSFLEKYFIKDVLGPIKYHVKAKKYLAKEKKYYELLSEASKISLKLQGGIMSNEEAEKFERNKFFENSIKLRKFDEIAKKSGLKIKSINEYKNLLISKLI